MSGFFQPLKRLPKTAEFCVIDKNKFQNYPPAGITINNIVCEIHSNCHSPNKSGNPEVSYRRWLPIPGLPGQTGQ